MANKGWIAVDFDGTLAKTLNWNGYNDGAVGEPIWPMVERVKQWLREGKAVRIFSARVGPGADVSLHRKAIEDFCAEYLGQVLPVTCVKDFDMLELWDDRAIQVEANTGEPTTYWVSRV
jgi:hypothetical protein